jgi:photosystem II stability/assembly factor-like uncharacterized protein
MSHSDEGGSSNSVIPGAQHIHAVTYDPEGNLLLGTHGGLFKSNDGGKAWQKVSVKGSVNADDWMSLVVDPRNRKIIFAGGHDLGVIKSIDGGITWMRSDEGIKGTDIHGLAINQRRPDLLFAYSVDNGVFKSKDSGVSWKRMDDGPGNPGVRSFEYMAVQTSMDKSMGGIIGVSFWRERLMAFSNLLVVFAAGQKQRKFLTTQQFIRSLRFIMI